MPSTELRALLMLVLALLLSAPAMAADGWLDVDGVRVHYTDEGIGRPVVLIHGFASSADINWNLPGMIARLTKWHRVLAIDCRGHGRSAKPTTPDQYGMHLVTDVVRLLDHLHIQQADLVGYSMGGMIAMKLMATNPRRVHRAVIGGMGWWSAAVANVVCRKRQGESKPLAACWQSLGAITLSRQELASLKTPMVVVDCRDDKVVQGLYINPLRRVRPDIPVKVVAGGGHFACIAAPDWLSAVDKFLGFKK